MIIPYVPPRPDTVDVILFILAVVEAVVILVIIAHSITKLFAPGDRR